MCLITGSSISKTVKLFFKKVTFYKGIVFLEFSLNLHARAFSLN